MWELDPKESWELKNWCFWTVVFESPLDSKEIQAVNPKRNQSWIFIGRTDAKAEALILWPPDSKNWLIGKDPDAGKDWRQEEKGMIGWHHQLDGHKFEQAQVVGDEQGSLGCCSPRGCKQLDTTEWLDWSEPSHCVLTWSFLWCFYMFIFPLIRTSVILDWGVKVLVAQSCLTLCDAMDCSLSGSSVHWISQARILDWVAISFSRGSSQPRDQMQVSCIAGRFFTIWAIRESGPTLKTSF